MVFVDDLADLVQFTKEALSVFEADVRPVVVVLEPLELTTHDLLDVLGLFLEGLDVQCVPQMSLQAARQAQQPVPLGLHGPQVDLDDVYRWVALVDECGTLVVNFVELRLADFDLMKQLKIINFACTVYTTEGLDGKALTCR